MKHIAVSGKGLRGGVIVVDMGENVQAKRLVAATAAAFGPLAPYGFRVEGEPDPSDWRGATVEVASATVTFTIMPTGGTPTWESG